MLYLIDGGEVEVSLEYLKDETWYHISYKHVGDTHPVDHWIWNVKDENLAETTSAMLTNPDYYDIQVVKGTVTYEQMEPPVLH